MTAQTFVRPVPVRLSRSEADLRRRLHQGRMPLELAWNGLELTLAVAPPRDVHTQGAQPVRLGLTIGAASGHLSLPTALARLLLDDAASPGGRPAAAQVPLDHPDLDLLVDVALAQPLAALETLLGRPLAVTRPAEVPADHVVIGWRVGRAGLPLGVAILRLAPAEAGLLAAALDKLPAQPTDLSTLPVQITAEAGSAWLSLAELNSLARGDIVLSDQTLTESTVALTVNRGRRLLGTLTEQGIRITGTAPTPSQGYIDMDQIPPQDGAPEAASLQDMTVRVVFEAARLDLPLAEIGKMRPGYVLDLIRPANLMVDLVVRGQCVGKAELVQVDNTLGARIVRLFGHD